MQRPTNKRNSARRQNATKLQNKKNKTNRRLHDKFPASNINLGGHKKEERLRASTSYKSTDTSRRTRQSEEWQTKDVRQGNFTRDWDSLVIILAWIDW
jgi:hypothetical protein